MNTRIEKQAVLQRKDPRITNFFGVAGICNPVFLVLCILFDYPAYGVDMGAQEPEKGLVFGP